MLNLKLQKIMIFMVDVSLGNYATTKGRNNIHIKTNYPSLIQFFKFKEKMIEYIIMGYMVYI